MTTTFNSKLSDRFPVRHGKVRDVYDLGEKLVIVATDRISAFDWVMPNGIPDKGRLLTLMSLFWLDYLKVINHLMTTDIHFVPTLKHVDPEPFKDRSMVVRKTEVVPIECVVRGYLAGSGWKEYKKDGMVCGIQLPPGLQESEQLPEPIFTPATKAETGHDVNISFEEMRSRVGDSLSHELRQKSIDLYQRGAAYALERGIIIADTKFEWGKLPNGYNILIDEVLTPDSSRFWPLDKYKPGGGQPSYDKQFVRDWLETTGWDKNSPPPPLPDDIVQKTREKYIEAYELLVGKPFPYK